MFLDVTVCLNIDNFIGHGLRSIRVIEYMTLKEAAEKWSISPQRINTLCLDGRIEGASKVGNLWLIPKDTLKPVDNRIKTGKYIKKKKGL